MRWTSSGEEGTPFGHKLFYSGSENRQLGVGFLVHNRAAAAVLSWEPISSRLATIRIAARPRNVSVIVAHAPHADRGDNEVEVFYEQLEETMRGIPKKDFLAVVGDWNAKVGPDAFEKWAGTVGQYGLGTTNDRGWRLLEFAGTHKMTLANTLFPHKPSRLATWTSPDGAVKNQIDYVLIPQSCRSGLLQAGTRVYPGADIGSDHKLVMASLRLKVSQQKRENSKRIRWCTEKLSNPGHAVAFQVEVGGRFSALNLLDSDLDVDALAENVKQVLHSSADKVLGRKPPTKVPWITKKVLRLCELRKTLKTKRRGSPEADVAYRRVHRKVQKNIAAAKEAWLNAKCDEVDEGIKWGDYKKAFAALKTLTNDGPRKGITKIEDKNGKLVKGKTEILNRLTEYCHELYNAPIETDATVLEGAPPPAEEVPDLQVLRAEVEAAIRDQGKRLASIMSQRNSSKVEARS
ncbi:uncharacterized protein LOC112566419 [Pomacea canaliculata]|uniref:uncharacterized protein LOC112566419 n=1 Tax=Pomacea canaliculata TaxID=400727 RepID=UPI000D727237|nr:uncharacterized protein LOC112566419 [Pomacea canaliculata]